VDAQETHADNNVLERKRDGATSGGARAEVVDLLAAGVVRLLLEHRRSAVPSETPAKRSHSNRRREQEQS
jgi:hypothetical protein